MPKTAAAPQKIDLYKDFKSEYVTPKIPVLIDTTKAKYLAVDGQGEPGGEIFSKAVGALYSAAYTIKMTKKFEGGPDYKVCALEALWDVMDNGAVQPDRSLWRWKVMIRVPDFVRAADLKGAVKKLAEKGKGEDAKSVRLEALKEGKCVQILHVGPYDKEGETFERVKEFLTAHDLDFTGRHHEIYLSDPKRVAPERLRTILRHPVAPIAAGSKQSAPDQANAASA